MSGKYIMKAWIILFWLLLLPIVSPAADFPEIGGWKPEGDVNIYRKDDLWQYIDGGAELFLMYGFQMLRFRDFSKGEMEMTVEIYDMDTPLNAFGVYTTERGEGVKGMPIGTEAIVVPPDYCQMFKERFYVKVKMQQGNLNQTSGEAILRSVDAFIGGKGEFPPELNRLPEIGKIAGTERYIAEGYMGLGELNHILFADYRNEQNGKFRYFLMISSTDKNLEETWQALSEKWRSLADKGHTILYRDIPYEGKIGIVRHGKGIAGVSNVAEMTDLIRYLRDIP